MNKRSRIYLLALLSITIAFTGTYAASTLIESNNPSSPFFKPEQFRFENYFSHKDMMKVMRELFPEKTEKDYVEKILVYGAGAAIKPVQRDFEAYSYMYTVPNRYDATWNIVVKYYENHTVDQIWVNGSAIHQYKPFKHGKIQ